MLNTAAFSPVSSQYIRECVGKEKAARVSIRYLRELVPETQDKFIRPVFSGESTEVSVNCTYVSYKFTMCVCIHICI